METYHKINAPFKRHMEGRYKGKLILGDWAMPELEYLQHCKWEFTEKVDGTNIRIGIVPRPREIGHDVVVGGRSDNAVIPVPLGRYLRETFPGDFFRDAFDLSQNDSATLFGEGYGPKIQDGGKYRGDPSFVLFDVKVGDWWLSREDVNDVARKLHIDAVPVIGQGTLQDAIDIVTDGFTWDADGRITRYGSRGLKSQWGDFHAEGIVARPSVPLFTRRGDRIITKIKGKDFK